METIVGFVAGCLVGTREGREGLDRLRSSWRSIRTSPEVRRMALDAVTMAEAWFPRPSGDRISGLGGAAGEITDTLVRRAAAAREGARTA